jgi:hypothetical protein
MPSRCPARPEGLSVFFELGSALLRGHDDARARNRRDDLIAR